MQLHNPVVHSQVPHDAAETFAAALKEKGVDATFQSYYGWSHTDAILEGLMEGDHRFHQDLCSLAKSWIGYEADLHPDGRMCWFVDAGRYFNVF